MMVLVDTSVWSLALRRKQTDLSAAELDVREGLRELVREGRARIAGPIRQELPSGVQEQSFHRLRDHLRALHEPALNVGDCEEAALMNNSGRARGISGPAIDFLICVVAHLRNWQIFTASQDFSRLSKASSCKSV